MVLVFGSVYVVNYVYRLAYVEPALHPWNEAYLIVMDCGECPHVRPPEIGLHDMVGLSPGTQSPAERKSSYGKAGMEKGPKLKINMCGQSPGGHAVIRRIVSFNLVLSQ